MNDANANVLAIVAVIGAVASGVVAIIKALGDQIKELRVAQAAGLSEQTAQIQDAKSASAERGAQVQGKLDVIHQAANSNLEALRHELFAVNERIAKLADERIAHLEQTIGEMLARQHPTEMLHEQARITEKAVELLGQSAPSAPAPPAAESPAVVVAAKDEGEKGS